MKGRLFAALGVFLCLTQACHVQNSAGVQPIKKLDKDDCKGRCGKGTRCVQGQCHVDYSKDVCGLAWKAAQDDSLGSTRVVHWGECPSMTQGAPTFSPVDDSKIPPCDKNKVRTVDLHAGNEKLSDEEIESHMHELEHAINACLATAACYHGKSLSKGSIDLQFRIAGSGSVEAVTCDVSADLNRYGVVPCTRKAVAEYRFPSFNGPSMTVDYQINLQ